MPGPARCESINRLRLLLDSIREGFTGPERSALEQHWREVARDADTIYKSAQARVFMGEDRAWLAAMRERPSPMATMIGTPLELRDQVAAHADAGVDERIIPDFTLGHGDVKKRAMDTLITRIARRWTGRERDLSRARTRTNMNELNAEGESHLSSSQAAAPRVPVPSGTIILLRDDATEGLEIFMVVRHQQIDFASGALVFPGGKISPQDEDPALAERCDGADPDPVMRAVQIGAIREAFEEAGVLLARPASAGDLVDGERLKTLEHYRDELHGGQLTLAEFLEREDLHLACDQLTRFAHWVTPEMMPKRFDTHFFIARAPEDHILAHDGHESVDSVWISPKRVLADARAGTRTVIFPTLRNVELLGESDTVEAATTAAQAREIVTVLPWIEQRDDGNWLRIPEEAGYLVSAEKMSGSSP